MLVRLRNQAPRLREDDPEGYFNAEQNAITVQNAETYYRTMVRGDAASWNVRDRHMVETLERLMSHHGSGAKAIVWEHNTHIGDARATDMARSGMVNVGQLVRERHGDEGVVMVGFGSWRGTVIAATEWEAPMERMLVPPGTAGSYEDLMHRAGGDRLYLLDELEGDPLFADPRGHRAIGVVYHPHLERFGNYVPTVLPQRYDAFLFVDETRALDPLHMPQRREEELPETFPSGV
jgi:erythromycin esterase-like protein